MYIQEIAWSERTAKLFTSWFFVEIIISILCILGIGYSLFEFISSSRSIDYLIVIMAVGLIFLWIWRTVVIVGLLGAFDPIVNERSKLN